jgi:hypothetical protein
VADWQTVASLATAGGTLVLAAATFSAVRSANRAARVAERSLLANMRPLVLATHVQDPPEKVTWVDNHMAKVAGGRAVVEVVDDVIYLAATIRNAGAGIAVLDGWHVWGSGPDVTEPPVAPDQFRRLTRDIYLPSGDVGFWQGSIREPDGRDRAVVQEALEAGDRMTVDLLYSDNEGGQRTITRLALTPIQDGFLCTTARHWNVDRQDPR